MIVNDDLGRIKKEVVVTYLRHYSDNCMEKLRETTKTSLTLKGMNPEPSEYEAALLPTSTRRSLTLRHAF
jgi:hypothetical protein